ncbi:MAG: hypothetical protein AB1679_28680 [Actinomycetota bacterium]
MDRKKVAGSIRSPDNTVGLSVLKEAPVMAEQRSAIVRIVGSSVPRRRRWVIGAVGALGASGLILGGVGVPVSADDVTAGGNPHASATVQDGCVTATAGTGEAGGSLVPQGDAAEVQAAGDGTATVSVCVDDLGDLPPGGDPGGSVPGDIDDVVPDDPGSLAAEVVATVTGVVEGGLPGDGDGPLPGEPGDDLPGGLDDLDPGELEDVIPGDPGDPGGDLPEDPGDAVPGDLGGLIPGGSGIDPGGLLDRVVAIIPAPGGDSGTPDGDGGGQPPVNPSGNGSVSGSVSVGSEGAERGDPTEFPLGAELERGEPVSVGTALSPGAALPRTGGGLGDGVLRLIALLGLGRGVLGLANRRRSAVVS